MKKQIQILTLMIRFLIFALILIAILAGLYFWSVWPSSPNEGGSIFIHTLSPQVDYKIEAAPTTQEHRNE